MAASVGNNVTEISRDDLQTKQIIFGISNTDTASMENLAKQANNIPRN